MVRSVHFASTLTGIIALYRSNSVRIPFPIIDVSGRISELYEIELNLFADTKIIIS